MGVLPAWAGLGQGRSRSLCVARWECAVAAEGWGMFCTDPVFLFSIRSHSHGGVVGEVHSIGRDWFYFPLEGEFGFMWEQSGKDSRDLRGDPGEPRGVPQFPVPGDAPGSGKSQPGARTGKKIHWEQT